MHHVGYELRTCKKLSAMTVWGRWRKTNRLWISFNCLHVLDIPGRIGECNKCAEIHHIFLHGEDNERTKQSGNCSKEPKFLTTCCSTITMQNYTLLPSSVFKIQNSEYNSDYSTILRQLEWDNWWKIGTSNVLDS